MRTSQIRVLRFDAPIDYHVVLHKLDKLFFVWQIYKLISICFFLN